MMHETPCSDDDAVLATGRESRSLGRRSSVRLVLLSLALLPCEVANASLAAPSCAEATGLVVPHTHHFHGSEAWVRLDPRADGSAVALAACGVASPAEVFTGSCDDLERHGTIELKCGRRSAVLLVGSHEPVYVRLVGGHDAELVLDSSVRGATAYPRAPGGSLASAEVASGVHDEARREDGVAEHEADGLRLVGDNVLQSFDTHDLAASHAVRRSLGPSRRLVARESNSDPEIYTAAELFRRLDDTGEGQNVSLRIMTLIELNQTVHIKGKRNVTLWSDSTDAGLDGNGIDGNGNRRVVEVRSCARRTVDHLSEPSHNCCLCDLLMPRSAG